MNIYTYINKNSKAVWVPALFYALGCIVLFTMVNYEGFTWCKDELYQSICVSRYSEAPLGLLTYYIGHLWTDIFGFTVVNLRYLTQVEILFAILLPTIFLYGLCPNRTLCALAFLMGCLMVKVCAFHIYNWDTGTYLFDSIAICLLISAISKPSLLKYILLGFGIGLMTMGRITSGVFLPFALVVVLFANRYNHSAYPYWRAFAGIVCAWIVCVLLVICLTVGSPAAYLDILGAGNVVSGHSPTSDFGRLYYRLRVIATHSTLTWTPGVGCMLLAVILPFIKKRIVKWLLVGGWICVCVLLSISIMFDGPEYPLLRGGDTPVGLALIIACPVYALFGGPKPSKLMQIELWSFVLLLVAISFGSDGYVERMIVGFSLPLLVGVVWKNGSEAIRRYVAYSVGMCVLVFGIMLGTQFANLYRLSKSESAVCVETPPFRNLKLMELPFNELDKAGEAVEFLLDRQIPYAYLGEFYLIELVYGQNVGPSFHNFHDNTARSLTWFKCKDDILSKAEAIVYVPDLPNFESDEILPDLYNEGFTDAVSIGEAVILFRSGKAPETTTEKRIESEISGVDPKDL